MQRRHGLPASRPATTTRPAVRGVRVHDLRHSAAVLWLTGAGGLVPPQHYTRVAQLLGHAAHTVTLNTYWRLDRGHRRPGTIADTANTNAVSGDYTITAAGALVGRTPTMDSRCLTAPWSSQSQSLRCLSKSF